MAANPATNARVTEIEAFFARRTTFRSFCTFGRMFMVIFLAMSEMVEFNARTPFSVSGISERDY